MKTLAYASVPAYPDEEGQMPNIIIELVTGEPQSRRGKEQLKKEFLVALERLFDVQGNPRRDDFKRDEVDWVLVRKYADKYKGKRWVVYELVERAKA